MRIELLQAAHIAHLLLNDQGITRSGFVICAY